ncbi:MAG: hypothetical protein AAGA83_02490 [Cyanobacteria bacterium P01_F01_bin.116]
MGPYLTSHISYDDENQMIAYRKGIGLNSLVMHRDANDENVLHLCLMSD